jgi:hypothetical protein
MRDAESLNQLRTSWCAVALAVVAAACGDSKAPPPPPPPPASASAAAPSTADVCPATGLWAECSLIYRLGRAGLALKVDSGARPNEKSLTGRPLVITLGGDARLELFLYPDSVARIADGHKLDRSALVNATAELTIKRERTLIESVNVIGLLTSINSHQRERVSDAITAGPPQPTTPAPKKTP